MMKSKFILIVLFSFAIQIAFGQQLDTIQQKIDYYISQAKLDSAKNFIQSHLANQNQKENISDLNYQLVKVYFMQSAYNEALKLSFSSLDMVNDKSQIVKFNFMIGCIYSAITDYHKSIEYFDLVIYNKPDSSLTVQTHLLLSQLHLELGDSTKARQSISAAYKITNFSKLDLKVKNHVAMQYNFFQQNYELCKQQSMHTINDSTSFLNAKSYAFSMMGDCLIRQDSLLKAAKYLNELLKLTVETKDPEQIKVAATKLITVYEQLGDQDKANVYHRIYNEALSDSLSFSVEKYRDLYNLEKNRELDHIQTNNLKNYLIFGSLLLFLLATGAYFFIYHKQKVKTITDSIQKSPGKKITISDHETEKIKLAINQLIAEQLFLTPKLTRKVFCADNKIKSERYLSQFINEEYSKSFSVFINELRIEYAFNRIKNDSVFRNYKIEEIAKAAGFGSKKSFERVFAAKYKETPYKLILRLSN